MSPSSGPTPTVEAEVNTQPPAEPAEPGAAEAKPAAESGETDTEPAAEPGPAAAEPADERAGTDDPQVTAPARRRSVRLSLPVAIIATAALVLALAAAVVFGVFLQRTVATDRAAAEALATARAYAVTVTSYDYQNLDRDFANVLDGATGEFKDQYSGASQTLRQLIINAKASAKGTVLDAGVSSASPDEVHVVVFADQTITNAGTQQPRLDRNRMLMTLTPHDGRWLVSELELR